MENRIIFKEAFYFNTGKLKHIKMAMNH